MFWMWDNKQQKAIAAAKIEIAVLWIEKTVRSNQYGSWRNPEITIKIFALCDSLGSAPETHHFDASSKNIFHQIVNENVDPLVEDVEENFGQNGQTSRSNENTLDMRNFITHT